MPPAAEIVDDPQDGTCTIQICQAGEYVVSLQGPPERCPQVRLFRSRAYRIDIDTYPNEIADPYDLTYERDAIENLPGDDEHPGLVIPCTTQDLDGDLVPDFADGMNLQPEIPSDDTAPSVGHPIHLSIQPPVPGEALIKFSYPASDPSKVVLGPEGWTPDVGSIRLWKSNGYHRDPRPIQDGGDYIPPGTYPANFFPLETDGTWKGVDLYVEAVQPSRQTGDIPITLTIDPDGPTVNGHNTTPFLCPDQIRLTAVDIRIHQLDPLSNEWLDTNGFVGTTFFNHEDRDILGPDWTPGPWCEYIVEIIDPRDLTNKPLFIADQDLAIKGPGPFHATTPFFCSQLAGWNDWIPVPDVIDLPVGGAVDVHYNPAYAIGSGPTFKPITDADKQIVQWVQDASSKMEEAQWAGTGGSTGEFGVALHQQVTLDLANHERWVADVFVDTQTGTIMHIGPRNSVSGWTQLDVVLLDEGYALSVGAIYDKAKCVVYDIKSGALKMSAEQAERFGRFSKDGQVRLVSTKRIWKLTGGWQSNPLWELKEKMFKIIGAVCVVAVAIDVYEQRERMEEIQTQVQFMKLATTDVARVDRMQNIGDLIMDFLRPQFELSGFGLIGYYPLLIYLFAGD